MAAEQAPVVQDAQNPAPATDADNVRNVFVGNLSFNTTEEGLAEFFKKSGEVLEARIITIVTRGKKTRSLGFGFVSFPTVEEAKNAAKELDKKELDGREINVEVAKPKDLNAQAERPRRRRSRNGKSRKSAKSEDQSESDGVAKEEPTATDSKEVQEKHAASRRKNRGSRKKRLTVSSTTSLFVGNLPYSSTDDDLKDLFTQREYVVNSAHIARMRNGRSKGYGFVEVDSEEAQQKALEEFKSGVGVKEREIYVKIALSADEAQSDEKDSADETANDKREKTESKPAAEKKTRKHSSSRKNKANKAEEGDKTEEENKVQTEKSTDIASAVPLAGGEADKPSTVTSKKENKKDSKTENGSKAEKVEADTAAKPIESAN